MAKVPAGSGLRRGDAIALIIAVVIIVVTGAVGSYLNSHGFDLVLPTPPLLAFWFPHVGWGTPLVVICVLVGLRLQQRAEAVGFGRLLLLGWLLGLGWLLSLILIDGLQSGWVEVLLDPNEYLHDLPRIPDVHQFLITFSDHIRYGTQPELAWTTHVAGHPPLATLVFVALERIGLGGGFWAGAACILASSAVAVALPVTVRDVAGEAAARRLVPLIALFPGAVWMGVSADGLFAGVATSGLALLTVATFRPDGRPALRLGFGLLGGLLLGATLYLSYGLALLAVVVAVIFVLGWRRHGRAILGAWIAAVVGVLAVAATFFALGFNWFTGLSQLHRRYVTSVASQRPYGYFVFGNLGAFLIMASPFLAVALYRAVRMIATDRRDDDLPLALLCVAGVASALLADVSGMSKAETERIWLAFGVYGFAGLALLRGRAAQWALIGAAGTAIIVNHLLDTGW